MYTALACPEIETKLSSHLDIIVQKSLKMLPSRWIQCILLAGGYGRHEGGVILENGRPRLQNNLDIVMVLHHRRHVGRAKKTLTALQDFSSDLCGVGVDISVCSIGDVKRNIDKIFWIDTLAGHCCLYGKSDPLLKHSLLTPPSLNQGLPLLVNRATLLLLNRYLVFYQANLPNIGVPLMRKHLLKATIGLGDIYLLLARRYTPSYKKRLDLLNKFPWILPIDEVRREVCQAIEKRFHREETLQPFEELVQRSEWVLHAYRDAFALYEAYRRKQPFRRHHFAEGYRSVESFRQQCFHAIKTKKREKTPQDRIILAFFSFLYGEGSHSQLENYLARWGNTVDSNFYAFLKRFSLEETPVAKKTLSLHHAS